MGTTPNVKRYLVNGVLSDVLPEIFIEYGNKPFTEADLREKVKTYRHGYLLRMYNLGIAEQTAGKSRLHIAQGHRTQWNLTLSACRHIKEYLEKENGKT